MHYRHFESRVKNVLSPLTKDNKAAVVKDVEGKISSTRESMFNHFLKFTKLLQFI
jgi:hypothetical protein